MNIFKNISMFLLIAVAAIQFGCKGKQGEPGPAGPNDPNAGLLSNGSFVKGTVTTSLANDTAVSFTFNYPYLYFPNQFAGSGNTSVLLALQDFKGISGSGWYKAAEVLLDLDSISDLTPANPMLVIFDEVALSDNQYFDFNMGGYSGVPVTLTNYQYDASTSTISGDFTATSSSTSNGKSATITGSFRFVGFSEVVYRKGVK